LSPPRNVSGDERQAWIRSIAFLQKGRGGKGAIPSIKSRLHRKGHCENKYRARAEEGIIVKLSLSINGRWDRTAEVLITQNKRKKVLEAIFKPNEIGKKDGANLGHEKEIYWAEILLCLGSERKL